MVNLLNFVNLVHPEEEEPSELWWVAKGLAGETL